MPVISVEIMKEKCKITTKEKQRQKGARGQKLQRKGES